MRKPQQKRTGQLSRNPHRGGGKRAFTILEVILATGVMALVISTSLVTLQSSFLSIDTARNVTLAGQIMMTEMEKMRMSDWSTVSAYPAGPTAVAIDPNFTNKATIGNRFSLTRAVTNVGGDPDILQISYSVEWKSYSGRPHSRSYSTYYARYGIRDYLYNSI